MFVWGFFGIFKVRWLLLQETHKLVLFDIIFLKPMKKSVKHSTEMLEKIL